MKCHEKALYSLLFLANKYTGFKWTEKWLHKIEDSLIKKYLPTQKVLAQEIPTIPATKLTQEKFERVSHNYRSPVLIKGLLKDSQAVKYWNEGYLTGKIGDFDLEVVEFEKKSIEKKKISFLTFLQQMKTKNLYVNNNHTLLAKFPQLFQDLQPHFSNLLKTLKKEKELRQIHIANLFIGFNSSEKEVTGSNTHAGGSGNFFCMLHGKKHWTLIDPKYSPLLKGRVAPSGIHAQTLFDGPDFPLAKVPKILEYLPRYEVLMEPGDVLWNAPWWWHRIRNENGLSIGMAIRHNKVTYLNLRNNLLYTMSGYIYLLYNSFFIRIYEKFQKKNFTCSRKEGGVLKQILALQKKYPKSILLKR